MKSRTNVLLLTLFSLVGTPLMAECNVFGILKGYDFCLDGYQRFAVSSISGASYQWQVLGTSWSQTTSINYINLNHGAVPAGNYTMAVTVTCPNCAGSDYLTTPFSMPGICRAPQKKQPSVEVGSDPFSALDLARVMARDDVFRVALQQPGQMITLVNNQSDPGLFYVFAADEKGRLHTNLLTLQGGEAREIMLSVGSPEAFVVSPQPFLILDDEAEWMGQRFVPEYQ